MKPLFSLTKRNLKEMYRDPLSIVFCIIFPLLMLVLMPLIMGNLEYAPVNFQIENYATGICVFGYTFTCLMVALQISSDKNTSFIRRINISPIKRTTYLFSFFLSALPVTAVQTILFYVVALIFGYPLNGKLFLSMVYLIPSACFYIMVGIFVGIICKNEKQTGPISSIFVSLAGILGGVFMPLESMSGGFKRFVNLLPFCHTVSIASEVQTVGAGCIYPHILWILGYMLVFGIIIFLVEKFRKE